MRWSGMMSFFSQRELKQGEDTNMDKTKPNHDSTTTAATSPNFHVTLTRTFVWLSVLSLSLIAFGVGRACRVLLLQQQPQESHDLSSNKPFHYVTKAQKMMPGEIAPGTSYSSKVFDSQATAESSCVSTLFGRTSSSCARDGVLVTTTENGGDNDDSDEDETIKAPAGFHVSVDLQDVDQMLIDSMEHLNNVMLQIADAASIPLLSFHCHSFYPNGKSCVGISLESHIAFHTWPDDGVLLFDAFLQGQESLFSLVPIVENVFLNPQTRDKTKPRVKWGQRQRGFHPGVVFNPEEVEVEQYLLNRKDMHSKRLVASAESKYQKIDIFDIIDPRHRSLRNYAHSLAKGGDSYEAQHPDLFRPDRMLYLNSVLQSRFYGDSAYHEALVHPALFTHPYPKRVAIIGGGEGATLREVLKHRSVETVTMIEIDQLVADMSREYLSEWSDCSDLVNSTKSCFDDPRAEVLYTDAISWLIERYADEDNIKDTDLYDVIVMDALDPNSIVEFSDILYNNTDFVEALSNALTDNGILVAQMGESDYDDDPPASSGSVDHRDDFINGLKEMEFEYVKTYDEANGGFLGVWSFLIAFMDDTVKRQFYANEGEVQMETQKRAMPTISGLLPFRYFDGPTMMSYQFPSRLSENQFCRNKPLPPMCDRGHGFDPELPNANMSTFTVKQSSIPNGGRGLFTTEAIPNGTYIAIEEGVHDILIMPSSHATIQSMLEHGQSNVWQLLDSYEFGYGFANDFYGGTGFTVDPSIMTFINHGCRGTNNMGVSLPVTELTADPNQSPEALTENVVETSVYNPFVDRNHLLYINSFDTINMDVEAGTELLDNYLAYLHDGNWKSGLEDYRSQCLNQNEGEITRYEKKLKRRSFVGQASYS